MSTPSYFLIRSKLSGLVLDIPNKPGEKSVIMYSANNGPNQQWTINEQGVIQSKLNSLTLEGQKLYELVVVNPATGTPAQQWIFTEQGLILNKKNYLALEILGQSKDLFVPVVLADIKDSCLAQQWELVPVQEKAPAPVAAPPTPAPVAAPPTPAPVAAPPTPPPVAAPPVSKSDLMINFFAEKSLEISTYDSSGLTASLFPTPPNTRQIKFKKGSGQGYIHLSFNCAAYFAEIDLFSENNEVEIIRGRYLRWPLTYNISPYNYSQGGIGFAPYPVPQFNLQVIECIRRIFVAPNGLKGEIEYNVGEDFLTLRSTRFPVPTSITMKVSPDVKAFLVNLINQ